MNHFSAIGAQLKDRGLDAMLVTSAPGEFYAAAFHGEGVALITPDQSWYWTDSRYIEAANQQITGAAVAVPDPGMNYRTHVQALVEKLGIGKLGFEEEYMSVSAYNLWTQVVKAEFVPASQLLTDLRAVKDADELAAMREAQRVTDEAFTEILNYIKPGVTESEIAAKLATCTGYSPGKDYAQDAINEIYARNGYIFKTAEVLQYYQAKSWYTPDANFTDAQFNVYEKHNIALLEKF